MSSDSPPTQVPNAFAGTVNRTLRILSSFAEKESWGLSELAKALELPRASAYRLLHLCIDSAYVGRSLEGNYVPGPELYRLAGRLASTMPIKRIAEPVVDALRDETEETAMLTLLVPSELTMFFAYIASPKHPMRYAIETNKRYSMAWGASGRALLAFLSPAEIDSVVERADPSPLDGRPLDADELRGALARIRRDGYAVTRAQRAAGAYGIAVPVYGSGDRVIADVAFTIPDFRFEAGRVDYFVTLLRGAAQRISRSLGVGAASV